MLNYKNTLIAFPVVLVLIIMLDYYFAVSCWIYAGTIIAVMLVMAWGSKNICSDYYIQAVCKGDPHSRNVSITFDDGPDAQVTPMILDVLKKYNVKATFFVIGSKAEVNPALLRRMVNEGHIVGGHSFSHHFFFDLFGYSRMKKELLKSHEVVYKITGFNMQLFRPPYGVTNPPLARAIRAMDYVPIGWSLKSKDTVIENELQLLKNLISKVKPGDIILFHDNKTWNVKVVDQFLQYLNEHDIRVIPLDMLLKINAYA